MKIMKRPLQVLRLININYVLLRNRMDTVVFSADLLQPLRFLSYLNPWGWFTRAKYSRGESIRIALEQLGPIFVKFGQILSTRRDILPDDIADELGKLQDKVPPFPGKVAQEILEKEYGKPLNLIFESFDLTPLASASIAQVHAATLKNGREVVVKIVRPNIEKIIQRDISLLHSVASFTEKFIPHGKRLRPREVITEFERSLIYELDLQHEGANTSQLRRNFLNSDMLYIPEVFWDYTTTRVLVLERIEGIAISDVSTLKKYGVNLQLLAERGVEIFFTQVLRDSFFHADMHPGNIFVSKENPQNPQYIAVDCGIMGSLSPVDQRYLAENLLAFFHRDYRRVAELHIESGWVGNQVRVDEFETAIRGVCEPIFERPLKDISFGKLLYKLFQTARQFHMEVQPQFVLLQKTLLNIEGLGRQLYPELDLWTTAKPYLEKWVWEKKGPRAILQKLYKQAPDWLDKMIDLPDLVHKALIQYTEKSPSRVEIKERKNIVVVKKKNNGKLLAGIGVGLMIMLIFNHIFYGATDHLLLLNIIIAVVAIFVFIFGLLLNE